MSQVNIAFLVPYQPLSDRGEVFARARIFHWSDVQWDRGKETEAGFPANESLTALHFHNAFVQM
jgi:hypothetical protein